MNELLARILEAHGGVERWRGYEKVEATIVSGGGFFALKGVLQDSNPRRMTAWLHEERSSVWPYGAPDQRTMFTPERIAIEKLDGTLVAERRAPKDSFAGHQMSTPWDPLHRAYFNGEALWTYLTTPFLLAMEGVQVEETEPWRERAETWRVLRALGWTPQRPWGEVIMAGEFKESRMEANRGALTFEDGAAQVVAHTVEGNDLARHAVGGV